MRKAEVERTTKETSVKISLKLDGKAEYDISSSIPFLDHMLTLMSHHGNLSLKIQASGDTEVDYHHLMEDIGITLGEVITKAIGDKKGIRRYGFSKIPMDETLAEVVIDLSGRP
ncbi:MAG: imidazoleglycerol-phosphate dehydratase, partial [Nitrospirae bacterium]